MPNYRRAFIANGYWFFTHNLLERNQTLLVDQVDALRCAFAETQKKYPFEIAAIVVLPDHLHAIWSLPPEDADFSTRWRLIKTRLQNRCRGRKAGPRCALRAANAASGSGGSGNTLSATMPITRVMSNIAPSIRLSIISCAAFEIGRTRHFTAMSAVAYFRSIGQEKLIRRNSSANGNSR
jgi:REP element-mobilizing transposase RayT